MKEIPLTRGLVALVDDKDFDALMKHGWFANGKENAFYAMRRDGVKKITMHRVIMQASPREHVDHINGNTLDNRRCNLRICTHALNLANVGKRRTACTSQFRGVRLVPQGWRADICIRGKRSFLGIYKDEKEAAAAWNKAAAEGWGSYARLNPV